MIKLIKVLFLISVLTACGRTYSGKDDREIDLISPVIAGGRALTNAEMPIALRICYAFRSKRTNYQAEYANSTFNFELKEKSCTDVNESTSTFATVLKMGRLPTDSMYFDSSSTKPYFKEVMTHVEGPISFICDEVIKGNTPLNLSQLTTKDVFEVNFFSDAISGDGFEIRYAAKVDALNTNYSVFRLERFSVMTNATSAGNKIGLVSEASRYESCPAIPNQIITDSVFKQNYIDN